MASKLAIKDVARVQKLPLSESDRLAKLVPDKIPNQKLNLKNAIAYVPELQAAEMSSDPLGAIPLSMPKCLKETFVARVCMPAEQLFAVTTLRIGCL
jgi:DNA polymerase-3 subunit alpha